MARRSATNPRYQKHAKVGSTRRSASSLKPKRPVGDAKPKAKGRRREPLPMTPEIRRWRRIALIAMGIGVAFALGIFIPGVKENRTIAMLLLAAEITAFGVALYIDWVIVRPLRLDAQRQAGKAKDRPEKSS